jgi:GxxExxY protein
MTEIIHKELSYLVRGVLFDVHSELGPLLPEKFYQEAVAIGLEKRGVRCETEKLFEVTYCGVQVGRYYVDVWLEGGQLLLELKVTPEILPLHRAQALSYLKVTEADLAIVANFGTPSLTDARLPNFLRQREALTRERKISLADNSFPQVTSELLCALQRVHDELGPGFFHQVYRRATMVELRQQGIVYEYIKRLPVTYRGELLGQQETRLICVQKEVMLATIAVKEMDESLKGQLRSKMKRHGVPFGLLVNFNGSELDVWPVRASKKNNNSA